MLVQVLYKLVQALCMLVQALYMLVQAPYIQAQVGDKQARVDGKLAQVDGKLAQVEGKQAQVDKEPLTLSKGYVKPDCIDHNRQVYHKDQLCDKQDQVIGSLRDYNLLQACRDQDGDVLQLPLV